ncbi:hypothetical protein [Aeromonas salmonicida]|uniref:hypothetical protein n=1 Tax=Aeromonas salmonicida TaxID=645 RepID=UPI003D1ACC73
MDANFNHDLAPSETKQINITTLSNKQENAVGGSGVLIRASSAEIVSYEADYIEKRDALIYLKNNAKVALRTLDNDVLISGDRIEIDLY